MVSIKKQVSMFMANQPGNLSNICAILADNEINILSIMTSDGVDHAVVRMTVDPADKALHIFGEMGITVLESDVLDVHLEPGPGSLRKVSDILVSNNINIDYIYGGQYGNDGRIFFKVNEPQRAKQILEQSML